MIGKIFKAFLFISLVFITFKAYSADIKYTFGRGLKINNITLSGYITFSYKHKKNYDEYRINEISIFGFIDLTEKLKFFAETELEDIYIKTTKEENSNPKLDINRLYLDYTYNDYFKIRFGKFITPIGYWNPVYVDVLKWTTSDPITATQFFPRFTTGIGISGYLPFQEDSWKYDLIFQNNKNIDENKSTDNIISEKFYGAQLKKLFWYESSVGIVFGYFKEKYLDESSKFIGFNTKLKYKLFELTSEYFYAREKEPYYIKNNYAKFSYYVQGVIRVFPKNYSIARYEFLKDLSDGKHIENYIFGWNYRPLYPISIKAEYKLKHRRVGGLNNYDHIILSSISVLF